MHLAVRVQVDNNQFYDIKLAPNQKVVTVIKSKPKGYVLDIEANKLARKTLSSDAYSLYMHFVLNVPGYTEALSLKHNLNTSALSERTYYKSINELITKGYLVKTMHEQIKEYYLFYEAGSEEI
jgi:predicted HTH transcriptional regulator